MTIPDVVLTHEEKEAMDADGMQRLATRRLATYKEDKFTKDLSQLVMREISTFLDEDPKWSPQQKGMQCLARFKVDLKDVQIDIKNRQFVE